MPIENGGQAAGPPLSLPTSALSKVLFPGLLQLLPRCNAKVTLLPSLSLPIKEAVGFWEACALQGRPRQVSPLWGVADKSHSRQGLLAQAGLGAVRTGDGYSFLA